MAVEKKTVVIDPELWARVQRMVAETDKGSASAVLNEALRLYFWRLEVTELITDLEAEHGPITDDEKATAEAEWTAATRGANSRRKRPPRAR
jgi:hypothetical protein